MEPEPESSGEGGREGGGVGGEGVGGSEGCVGAGGWGADRRPPSLAVVVNEDGEAYTRPVWGSNGACVGPYMETVCGVLCEA